VICPAVCQARELNPCLRSKADPRRDEDKLFASDGGRHGDHWIRSAAACAARSALIVRPARRRAGNRWYRHHPVRCGDRDRASHHSRHLEQSGAGCLLHRAAVHHGRRDGPGWPRHCKLEDRTVVAGMVRHHVWPCHAHLEAAATRHCLADRDNKHPSSTMACRPGHDRLGARILRRVQAAGRTASGTAHHCAGPALR